MGTLPREIHLKPIVGSSESWCPGTDAERDAVREQLRRLLGSDLFANSKRYPNLLKHIVEETLASKTPQLKERTLGVEVFGRDPSYDTNLDPVVRTSAAQVRHRLALYYDEPGHENEIRIELLPGSYVPQFRRPSAEIAPAGEISLANAAAAQSNEAIAPASVPPISASPRSWRRLRWPILAGAVCLAVATGFVVSRWFAPDPVAAFWGPLWDKSSAILICVPGKFPTPESPTQTAPAMTLPDRDPRTPLSIHDSLRLNLISFPDAATLYSLTGFIQAHGQNYRVRREGDLPFSDLRTAPVVMVGGFNNRWLMRLMNHYRFTYQQDNAVYWIRDAQKPSRRDWKVVSDQPYSTFDVDYGIISRVWDFTTGHWIVVASGIASYGTVAAGEFLTRPEHLETLARYAPRGWQRKNLQVVFATKVFNGNAGPPQILTVHVW